jgi:hypothetical protein
MNQKIADYIKFNDDKIITIKKAIELKEGDSEFLTLLPSQGCLERRKMKLEAINEVLRYYQEKLGERERLETGRRLHALMRYDNENFFTIEFYLDGKTDAQLYERVSASSSDNFVFFNAHFYALASYILNYDLVGMRSFFKRFGLNWRLGDGKDLWFSKKDFDKDVEFAKKHIDRVFKLFEDKKLMDRVEDALDAYLKAVFESNPEEE